MAGMADISCRARSLQNRVNMYASAWLCSKNEELPAIRPDSSVAATLSSSPLPLDCHIRDTAVGATLSDFSLDG